MKNVIMILALLLVIPGLTGCGKKDNKRTGISNRNARNPINEPTPEGDVQSSGGGHQVSTAGYIYGQIYNAGGRSDAQFVQNVKGFTSATLDPWGDPQNGVAPELGTFSAKAGSSTGIWIRGDARVSGGSFDPSGQNRRGLDLQNTNIRIIIWDSYAGQTDGNGDTIPEYGVSFLSATGESYIDYQNRRASLKFEDEYGWVKFTGTFDENWFHGTVDYYNYSFVDSIIAPNDRAWGRTMGDFYISTCGFFYCE